MIKLWKLYSDSHNDQAQTSKEGNLEVKQRFNSSITLLCLSVTSHNEKVTNQYLTVSYYKQRKYHLKLWWLTLPPHKRLILFFNNICFKKSKKKFVFIYFSCNYIVIRNVLWFMMIQKLRHVNQLKNIFTSQ